MSSTPISGPGQEDPRTQSATQVCDRETQYGIAMYASHVGIEAEVFMEPSSATGGDKQKHHDTTSAQFAKDFNIVPIPLRLRYHEGKPFPFGILLNAWFGVASTFGG